MSKFGNEIPVEVASLHQQVYLAGFGATDKTLSDVKMKGIKMNLLPQGLHVSFKNREYIIPHAAIGSCLLYKEKTKAKE